MLGTRYFSLQIGGRLEVLDLESFMRAVVVAASSMLLAKKKESLLFGGGSEFRITTNFQEVSLGFWSGCRFRIDAKDPRGQKSFMSFILLNPYTEEEIAEFLDERDAAFLKTDLQTGGITWH